MESNKSQQGSDAVFKVGTTVLGAYKLAEHVEESQSGDLWVAKDEKTSALVFVKMINPEHIPTEAAAKDMMNGIRLLIGAKCDHVAGVLAAGLENKRVVFAMERPVGPTIGRLLEKGRRFTETEGLDVVVNTARGLEQLLTRVGSHCGELKPSKIIVSDTTGKPTVCEAGIGALLYDTAIKRGETLGSPHYMSPEQCGAKPADWRSDMYALGAVLYHMVVGSPPFESEQVEQIMRKQTGETIQAPLEKMLGLARLGADTAKLIRRMMAKKPEERFSSWSELIAEAETAKKRLGGADTEPAVKATPADADKKDEDEEERSSLFANPRTRKLLLLVSTAAAAAIVIAVLLGIQHSKVNAEKRQNAELELKAKDAFDAAEARLATDPKDFDTAIPLYELAIKTPSAADRALFQRKYGEVLFQQQKDAAGTTAGTTGRKEVDARTVQTPRAAETGKPTDQAAKQPSPEVVSGKPAPDGVPAEKSLETATRGAATPEAIKPSDGDDLKSKAVNEALDKAVAEIAQCDFKTALALLEAATPLECPDATAKKTLADATDLLADVRKGEESVITAFKAEIGKTIPLKIGSKPLTEVKILSVKDDGTIVCTPKGEKVGGRLPLSRLHPEERTARAKFGSATAKNLYQVAADINAGRMKDAKALVMKTGCLSDRLLKLINERSKGDVAKKDAAEPLAETAKTTPPAEAPKAPEAAEPEAPKTAEAAADRPEATDDLDEIASLVNKFVKNLNSRFKTKRGTTGFNKTEVDKDFARMSYLASLIQDRCMRGGGKDVNIRKPIQLFTDSCKALIGQRGGDNEVSFKWLDQLDNSISSLKSEFDKIKPLKLYANIPAIHELEPPSGGSGDDEAKKADDAAKKPAANTKKKAKPE